MGTLFTSKLQQIQKSLNVNDVFHRRSKQGINDYMNMWFRGVAIFWTHLATLIILGPKALTWSSRVFMVFPVSTMACESENTIKDKRNTTNKWLKINYIHCLATMYCIMSFKWCNLINCTLKLLSAVCVRYATNLYKQTWYFYCIRNNDKIGN